MWTLQSNGSAREECHHRKTQRRPIMLNAPKNLNITWDTTCNSTDKGGRASGRVRCLTSQKHKSRASAPLIIRKSKVSSADAPAIQVVRGCRLLQGHGGDTGQPASDHWMPDPNLDSANCSAAAACSGSTSSSPLAAGAAQRRGRRSLGAPQPPQEQPSAPSAPGRRRRPPCEGVSASRGAPPERGGRGR